MVVVMVVVVMVVRGSGKCRTGKNNKQDGSAKLCHGENVARALHHALGGQEMRHQDRKWTLVFAASKRHRA